MSEVHKLVCDVCSKEKDLNEMYLGGEDNWQRFVFTDSFHQRKTQHTCSIECAIKLLQGRA